MRTVIKHIATPSGRMMKFKEFILKMICNTIFSLVLVMAASGIAFLITSIIFKIFGEK